MFSNRFQKPIRLTVHAQQRMMERNIPESIVLDLIETGTLKSKDKRHLWLFKRYPERDDNMLCIAAVNDEVLVVKTITNHWQEIKL